MSVRRSDEAPRFRGVGRMPHAIGGTLLSCVRLPAALFERLFRLGITVLFKAPIAMLGLLFIACVCLLLFGLGQRIYDYNRNPLQQLRSARNALTEARKMDHDIAELRRGKGLPPGSSDQLFAPALETKVERLEAEIARSPRPAGPSNNSPDQTR